MYQPLTIHRYRPRRRIRGVLKRWIIWGFAVGMLPAIGFAAYEPAFLLPANNLSDVAAAATAWSNLGGGTAGKKAASDNTKATVASVPASVTIGHVATFVDTAGTLQDGGAPGTGTVSSVICGSGLSGGTITTTGTCAVGPTAPTIYTSTSPVTLAATMNLFEVIEMATPAALTINLPATPSAGMTLCVKDGLKNFATFNATIKTTDSGTIDKVTGATGFVMNQNGQSNCFQYASSGTNWYVY